MFRIFRVAAIAVLFLVGIPTGAASHSDTSVVDTTEIEDANAAFMNVCFPTDACDAGEVDVEISTIGGMDTVYVTWYSATINDGPVTDSEKLASFTPTEWMFCSYHDLYGKFHSGGYGSDGEVIEGAHVYCAFFVGLG